MTPLSDATPRSQPSGHLCSFYSTEEEKLASLLSFFKPGLERGEKCLYLAEEESRIAPLLAVLKSEYPVLGANVENEGNVANRSGALAGMTVRQAYFAGPEFQPNAVLDFWTTQKAQSEREGFTGLRAAVDMDWLLYDAGGEHWIGYENVLANALSQTGCRALCQYDQRAGSPAILLSALRNHPAAICAGMTCENVYYVPPEEARISDFTLREVERRLRNLQELEHSAQELRIFRALVDGSNNAIEIVDPETNRILDVSHKSCLALGYSREELVDRTIFDIDPLISPASVSVRREGLWKTGGIIVESVRRRKDGTTFPVEVNLRLVRLHRTYCVGVTYDLTERKRLEATLREREDHYRDLVEHSCDLICTHDLEGQLLSVNDVPCRILGYSREEILATPMSKIIPPEHRQLFNEYMNKIRRDGSAEGLLAVMTKSGERRIWKYHNTLRTEGVSKPIVRGIAHDVTEQKHMEKALRNSEEKFSKAFRCSPEILSINSLKEGRFIEVNEAFEAQSGYTRAEVIGRTDADLGIWLDLLDRDPLGEYIFKDGRIREQELRLRTKAGQLRTVLVSIEIIELDGEACALRVGQDITRLKEVEEGLRGLSGRFMNLQEEERRRIARELHDSTAQELAGLRMGLGAIKRAASSRKFDRKALQTLNECQEMAKHCAREIRTISYLLHPPLIEDFGLVLALRGYMDGFGKRSGLRVKLEADAQLEQTRLPTELETNLFRIVQEGLTNIKNHSGSASASITLNMLAAKLPWKFGIEDEG
jgi:PAS domain S-box-containing protein